MLKLSNGPVAQLVRVLRSHRRGQRFESSRVHPKMTEKVRETIAADVLLKEETIGELGKAISDFQDKKEILKTKKN